MKALTLLATLVTMGSAYSGELLVNGGPQVDAISFNLVPLEKQGGGIRPADNFLEADEKNPFRWENLKSGKYLVYLDPDYEDWSSHCIGGFPVDVGEGVTTLDVKVPSGRATVTVKFGDVKEPKQDGGGGLVFRVAQLQANGEVDPWYKQWLWASKKDGEFVGPLDYLEPGIYRIFAFELDEQSRMKDVGSGDMKLDASIIKKGSATVTIDKKVEQAGHGDGE